MSKVKSSKGATVDFDLMRLKAKMENRNKPDSVELREKYIDIRRRRNPRRNVADLENEQRANETDARDKLRLSKEAKIKADAAAKAVPYVPSDGGDSMVIEPPVVIEESSVPEETPPEVTGNNATSPKKTIVKRTPKK